MTLDPDVIKIANWAHKYAIAKDVEEAAKRVLASMEPPDLERVVTAAREFVEAWRLPATPAAAQIDALEAALGDAGRMRTAIKPRSHSVRVIIGDADGTETVYNVPREPIVKSGSVMVELSRDMADWFVMYDIGYSETVRNLEFLAHAIMVQRQQ